jgi:hypothetical protein
VITGIIVGLTFFAALVFVFSWAGLLALGGGKQCPQCGSRKIMKEIRDIGRRFVCSDCHHTWRD